MAILAECPICHRKQSTKNKKCRCGNDLDKAKKSRRVKYWIAYRYRDPESRKVKQRKESLAKFEGVDPYSISDAKEVESKRRIQRKELRIFDIVAEANMSFFELADWYLSLPTVEQLTSFRREKHCLANFNREFGNQIVSTITPMALEAYQIKREQEGKAAGTIDMEIGTAKRAIRKAWHNDKVSGRIVKVFSRVKNKLRVGDNARDRILTPDEYLRLVEASADHLEFILIVAYHSGMRHGEILSLQWKHIDHKAGMIRLPAELVKERKAKSIPINRHVRKVLEGLPPHLHHDFVFTRKGRPLGEIRRAFLGACQRAGIVYGMGVEGGLRFHDIRTTFKMNLLRAGVDKVIRDTIVGQSLQGMDRYYLKPSDEDLRAAMDQFTAWIDAQLKSVHQNVAQAAFSG